MITGHLTGDASMLLYLRSRGIVLREELRATVQREGIRLLGLVKAKVSGPVLKNRTGTLRRKLNVQFTETTNELSASVGLKLAYAAAHEYGFDGVVSVREHLSRSTKGTAFTVRAHTRHMRLPERSYLRSTLREEAPTIREQLQLAVQRSLA